MNQVKIYLSTLGCKLNESELEAWARQFASDGYQLVDDPQSADVVLLNTCTVTHVAARKSRQMARQLARANPNAQLLLTGCYVSVSPEQAQALPNVGLIVPNADKDRLVALAGKWLNDTQFQTTETGCRLPEATSGILGSAQWLDADVETQAAGNPPIANPQSLISTLRTRAFVKIQDGCNMSCTYCIIPLARGKERSRPIAEIIAEVNGLVAAGYKEIILTGVQISAYRTNDAGTKSSLRDLVAAILNETNVPRLRMTSIAPWDLDKSLLELWSDKRLCRHLHLSLQSGSDTVLRRMRRPSSTAEFARVAEMSYNIITDVGITTDVIVGFPGESAIEFEQSLRFVERMRFARVHVFPYSPRTGTLAANLPQVADSIKQARVQKMQVVANSSLRLFTERFIGREMSVLCETCEGDDWLGYTDNYIRVAISSRQDLTNKIISAELISVVGDGAKAIEVRDLS